MLMIFSQVTAWDRAWGGMTAMLHIEGFQPDLKMAAAPENIRCRVYFPPRLLKELPDVDWHLAKLVQQYIEGLGMVFVQLTKDAFAQNG